MSVQGSMNQMLGSAVWAASLGKHASEQKKAVAKQEEANELARGKELVDLKNKAAETEESIANMQEGQQVLQERNPEIGTPVGDAMLAEGDEDLTRAVKAINILDKKITAKQTQLGWINDRMTKLGGNK